MGFRDANSKGDESGVGGCQAMGGTNLSKGGREVKDENHFEDWKSNVSEQNRSNCKLHKTDHRINITAANFVTEKLNMFSYFLQTNISKLLQVTSERSNQPSERLSSTKSPEYSQSGKTV